MGAARLRVPPQITGKSGLFGVLALVLLAGDDIGAGKPAVEVDVAAAGGTKGQCGGARGLAAFRAGFLSAVDFGNVILHGGASLQEVGEKGRPQAPSPACGGGLGWGCFSI